MENELCHHGILGMKWGIRRYQNKDGSLTAAGRKRYGLIDDNISSERRRSSKMNDDLKEQYDRASKEAMKVMTSEKAKQTFKKMIIEEASAYTKVSKSTYHILANRVATEMMYDVESFPQRRIADDDFSLNKRFLYNEVEKNVLQFYGDYTMSKINELYNKTDPSERKKVNDFIRSVSNDIGLEAMIGDYHSFDTKLRDKAADILIESFSYDDYLKTRRKIQNGK